MACIATSQSIDCEMGCQTLENQDSKKLRCLANRLRCYQPPSVNGETENGIDQGINSTNNTRITKPVEAKQRRAAVLICLFKGTEGELRVILTKRSMNLSSHPGIVIWNQQFLYMLNYLEITQCLHNVSLIVPCNFVINFQSRLLSFKINLSQLI